MSRHKLGAATSGVEISPKKRKRLAKQRAAEAKAWAAKSGEVKVYLSSAAEKCTGLRSRKVHHRLEVMAAVQAESRNDGA